MLRVSVYLALIALCSHKTSAEIMSSNDEKRPNVILMHVNNLVKMFITKARDKLSIIKNLFVALG